METWMDHLGPAEGSGSVRTMDTQLCCRQQYCQAEPITDNTTWFSFQVQEGKENFWKPSGAYTLQELLKVSFLADSHRALKSLGRLGSSRNQAELSLVKVSENLWARVYLYCAAAFQKTSCFSMRCIYIWHLFQVSPMIADESMQINSVSPNCLICGHNTARLKQSGPLECRIGMMKCRHQNSRALLAQDLQQIIST